MPWLSLLVPTSVAVGTERQQRRGNGLHRARKGHLAELFVKFDKDRDGRLSLREVGRLNPPPLG